MLVKVGGSVADKLHDIFDALKTHERVYVLPGGWIFADFVREMDRKVGLSSEASHWMAILGMNMYGYYMAEIAKKFGFSVIEPIDFNFPHEKAIILPYALIRKHDELPHSWDVTSDSIAVWIAWKARLEEVVKVTAGRITDDRGNLVREIDASQLITDVVDNLTPKLLVKYGINMFVCSPEELKNYILRGRANGTLIKGR